MEFKKIEIEVAEEIKEFLACVQEIDLSATVVGDYLFESFIEQPGRHIDIYVKSQYFNEIIEHVSHVFKLTFQKIELSTYTCLFDFKGYTFQLIFTQNPEDEVKYQDIRVREFYYDGTEAYASVEALEDLEDWVQKIGIVKDPLKTYVRLYDYFIRFGLKIDTETRSRLIEQFNEEKYSSRQVITFLEENTKGILKEKLTKHLTLEPLDAIIKFNIEKKNEEALRYLKKKNYKVDRDLFDKIYEKDDFYEQIVTYETSGLLFEKKIKEIEQEIKNEFKKELVKLIFYYPEEVNMWKEKLEDPTFFYLFLPKIIKKIETDNKLKEYPFYDLKTMLDRLDDYSNQSIHMNRKLEMKITNRLPIYEDFKIKDYLNNRYVLIYMGKEYYIVYDMEKEKICTDKTNISTYQSMFYQEIIKDVLEKNKTLI